MKKISLILTLSLVFCVNAFAKSDEYYQIDSVKVNKVSSEYIDLPILPFADVERMDCDVSGLEPDRIDFTDIMNIGKDIWTIVEKGAPTLDYTLQSATAVPRSAKCAFNLESWNRPVAHTFDVVYENKLGMEVVNFRYKVIFTYGGTFKTTGKYLANVSVHPVDIKVNWGFSFNADVVIKDLVNTGTKANPKAGMELFLHWKTSNVLNKHEAREIYFVEGDGNFTRL